MLKYILASLALIWPQAISAEVLDIPIAISQQEYTNVVSYGKYSVKENCKEQRPSWCRASSLPTKSLTAGEILDTSLEVRQNFIYILDIYDSWRIKNHTENVWFGDCDDITLTTIDALIKKKHPRNKIWFALVSANQTNRLDHLVGIVEDSQGNFWVVGDTNEDNAYPLKGIEYRVLSVARLDTLKWKLPGTISGIPGGKTVKIWSPR